jgi:diphthine-ammonia ligase
MYLASWSGGKDSCLACYHAIKEGKKVSRLIHFDRPNNLHGVDPSMIRVQAALAGIPLVQRHIAKDDFEHQFKMTVASLKKDGIAGMIFGDIYLEPHKEWVDRTCAELGIEPVEPLWGRNSEDIVEDFLNDGFETIVASGNLELIDRKYIGRKMDREFIEYLKERNLDVCGESGEFHTFVTKGPLLQGRIEIKSFDVFERNGFWFLDVKKYAVST